MCQNICMYVIIERERHPGSFIGNVYGPYPDYKTASAEADRMYNSASNTIPHYGWKRSVFLVHEMTALG